MLLIAAMFEVGWAVGLKMSDGFSKLAPTAFTIVSFILSFVFLFEAVKELPIGTAYAVWTGIGAAGTVILGILLFGEPKDAVRLLCLVMIVAGIVGLKLTS
ncbi:MAG TPA: multidrug efflux SMR transporter, partial [Methanomassiliicoccaceae archaeon]|jgi:quaternary ammonium compound-resistance protein SugE|nr:multidrug efflux SMR transporter [Methanomassiliicoccaceae archaeon]HPT74223.1 multidrug efflux SMR transporter [Methanomassiliicoccaceae archaeon]HQA21585.1 multidrug efflux SMR transporter [Methanomassiliicoccaceae archaeon]HQD88608.1 multidrug efflux SMR transporter [Methanomassiliicoccaceae archaeon]